MFKGPTPESISCVKIGRYYVTGKGFHWKLEDAFKDKCPPDWTLIEEICTYLEATYSPIKKTNNLTSHVHLKHIFSAMLNKKVSSGNMVIAMSHYYRVVHGKFALRHFNISNKAVTRLRKMALFIANKDNLHPDNELWL